MFCHYFVSVFIYLNLFLSLSTKTQSLDQNVTKHGRNSPPHGLGT